MHETTPTPREKGPRTAGLPGSPYSPASSPQKAPAGLWNTSPITPDPASEGPLHSRKGQTAFQTLEPTTRPHCPGPALEEVGFWTAGWQGRLQLSAWPGFKGKLPGPPRKERATTLHLQAFTLLHPESGGVQQGASGAQQTGWWGVGKDGQCLPQPRSPADSKHLADPPGLPWRSRRPEPLGLSPPAGGPPLQQQGQWEGRPRPFSGS